MQVVVKYGLICILTINVVHIDLYVGRGRLGCRDSGSGGWCMLAIEM
jgi:hypothetical protein